MQTIKKLESPQVIQRVTQK